MFTARRPRNRANSTLPATSANSVSSSPRPTPRPGWKWVPRWRTMISPAFTRWPPKRLTPSRCAFESRPLRLEDAPFLCAMSCQSLRLLGLPDPGDPDLGVLLPVSLATLVTRLVPVVDHVDLRPLGRADHLAGDLVLAKLRRVADDRAVVHHEQGGERNARPGLFVRKLVDGEHVIKGDLLLPATAAHNRVHPRTASPCMRAPPVLASTVAGLLADSGLAMNLTCHLTRVMAMHGTTARALELTGRRGIALIASPSIPGPAAAIGRPRQAVRAGAGFAGPRTRHAARGTRRSSRKCPCH